MPRTNDPLGILTGPGLTSPGSVSPSSLIPADAGGGPSLAAHVNNPTGAHAATAISITDPFQRYVMGPQVGGALDELAALVPPAMGVLGSVGVPWLGSLNVGVPDWGILKLHDGVVLFSGNPSPNPYEVYPLYYRAPVSHSGVGALAQGMDLVSDPMFNVVDGLYTGGGKGLSHAGFVSLPMGGPTTGYPTWRIIEAQNNPYVVVSGIVYPGDRGVLALVRWPTGDAPTPPGPATTVADIQDRCLAALLMGKGLLGSGGCDGDPGGIFVEATGGDRAQGLFKYLNNPAAGYTITLDLSALPGGPPTPVTFTSVAGAPSTPFEFTVGGSIAATTTNLALAINTQFFPELLVAAPSGGVLIFIREPGTVGNTVVLSTTALPADILVFNPTGGTDVAPSPYRFPGRASGQYNLAEINGGISVTAGIAPFLNPAAGQVRLLTDPAAVTFPAPRTVAGGMPIFTGSPSSIGTTIPVPWLPFDLGGGDGGNFFAYRLPYLKDYLPTTGLIYTPATEKPRFFNKLLPALGGPGTLPSAGNYDNFTENFWAYQVSRYRHRFVLNAGAPTFRLDNNFALVHFKKEEYFEKYVRDGVVPTQDQVYSINLVSFTGNTPPFDDVLNLTDANTPPTQSIAYDVNRSEVVEDDQGTTPLVYAGLSYELGLGGPPSVTYVSGVSYLVPLDITQPLPGFPNVGIKALAFDVKNPFSHGYRSHDTVPSGGPLFGDNRKYALNQNMAVLSLSSFAYEGDELLGTSTVQTGTALFPASLGVIRRQRVEFGYADLTNPVTDTPSPADHALYNFLAAPFSKGITFKGDVDAPAFTQDAKVRLFFRRPLVVDSNGFPNMDNGVEIPVLGGLKVLFHSMQEASDTVTVPYGNPSVFGRRGVSVDKDKIERFLDEVYRYPDTWTPLGGPDKPRLIGPGIVAAPAPILVPVRPTGPNYTGWLGIGDHTAPLDNVTLDLKSALQVTGLPERNPSYKEGLPAPFPSRGILQYPKTDYSTGYNPTGPDYTTLTGTRTYVRAFDAGITNAGQSTVKFRLWGVELLNFQYTGGLTPGSGDMAVLVKIPGLTTWMDAGRTDGTGPGKQDLLRDGAGCLMSSFESTDVVSQLHYTDLTLNVGPAFLFDNGSAMCPVLVKVVLYDTPGAKALDFTNVIPTGLTFLCRGLVGIDVI